jgi:serine/threonine protein kinase
VTPARLVGVRTPYEKTPRRLRDWIEDSVASKVVDVLPRIGGMSPAVASTLLLAGGERVFVKAVSADINPDTPDHFRHEMAILRRLPDAPYRADLLGTYEDGGWVAMLLEDVDGNHPDWALPGERERILGAVLQQADELTPVPDGLPEASTRVGLMKYVAAIENATEAERAALPAWALDDLPRLTDLVRRSLDHHRDETFNHWDIRHDNILMRGPERQPVFVDWGMARRGPRWGDPVVFGLEWVHEPWFDVHLSTLGLAETEQRDITGFLAGLGLFCVFVSTHPPHPSLPSLPAFRRDLGLRCLAGVRRRTQ